MQGRFQVLVATKGILHLLLHEMGDCHRTLPKIHVKLLTSLDDIVISDINVFVL